MSARNIEEPRIVSKRKGHLSIKLFSLLRKGSFQNTILYSETSSKNKLTHSTAYLKNSSKF